MCPFWTSGEEKSIRKVVKKRTSSARHLAQTKNTWKHLKNTWKTLEKCFENTSQYLPTRKWCAQCLNVCKWDKCVEKIDIKHVLLTRRREVQSVIIRLNIVDNFLIVFAFVGANSIPSEGTGSIVNLEPPDGILSERLKAANPGTGLVAPLGLRELSGRAEPSLAPCWESTLDLLKGLILMLNNSESYTYCGEG